MSIIETTNLHKKFQRVREIIAIIKIQRTIRSHNIEKMAQVERAKAMMHKVENYIECQKITEESTKVNDLLQGMDKKKETKITFDKTYQAQTNNGFTYEEGLNINDGMEKPTVLFTLLLNSWFNSYEKNISFFDGYAKAWVNNPSSKEWGSYLDHVISLLEEGGNVILWGANGGNIKLYPNKHKKATISLRDYWTLYNIKKEILVLQQQQEEYIKPRSNYQVNGGSGNWINGTIISLP